MGEVRNVYRISVGKPRNGKGHFGNLCVNGRMLTLILEKPGAKPWTELI